MLKKILLILVSMLMLTGNAHAIIYGAHGVTRPDGPHCQNYANSWNESDNEVVWTVTPGVCTITVNGAGAVPTSGYYSVATVVKFDYGERGDQTFSTGTLYVDSTKSLNDQSLNFTGGVAGTVALPAHSGVFECWYLVDANRNYYPIAGDTTYAGSRCTDGFYPLPPAPPVPTTSCTINDGSALSVSLGTLDRDEIPSVPDSGSAISKTISVVCTGGAVTANMQLNYTPISVGSNQAVKTSANGVGAAIFYSNKVLAPADVTSVNFLEGSNTLTLGFQAVRDSTVASKDIPTGAFTANAVLVMPQQ